MLRKLLGAMVLLCLLALSSQAADDKKTDKDKLQGTWDMVSVEYGGMKIDTPKNKQMSLVFEGNNVTKVDEKKEDGTYTLDEKKKPKEIDLTYPKDGGKEKETIKAIYKLDGETLKVAFPIKPADPRPTGFDSKAVGIMNFKKKAK